MDDDDDDDDDDDSALTVLLLLMLLLRAIARLAGRSLRAERWKLKYIITLENFTISPDRTLLTALHHSVSIFILVEHFVHQGRN